jgi:hypothetical protein
LGGAEVAELEVFALVVELEEGEEHELGVVEFQFAEHVDQVLGAPGLEGPGADGDGVGSEDHWVPLFRIREGIDPSTFQVAGHGLKTRVTGKRFGSMLRAR